MQTNPFVDQRIRKFVGLHSDEAYDYACGTYLSSKWAIRDLANRHGLTESEVENDIQSGLVELPSIVDEPSCGPLEKANFRIGSAEWPTKALSDGARVKTNSAGDVWELVDGPFAGEQFFTLESALRETAKAGKRMPTNEDWLEMIFEINPEILENGIWKPDSSVREALDLKIAGYCSAFSSDYCMAGRLGFFWSSTLFEGVGHYFLVTPSQIVPAKNAVRTNGFSVRCMAE